MADDAAIQAADDEFWSVLEKRICEQINDIDAQVRELYVERDRLQQFLSDHGRRCK